MANYETLKDAIRSAIRENGNNEITGNLLQQTLISMITSLGAQYQYAGIATPATNPGTPDQNVFYIASAPGTYANFGSIVVNDGEKAILKYNGTWTKDIVFKIVNNLETGGESDVLAAEQGKVLGELAVIKECYPRDVVEALENTRFNASGELVSDDSFTVQKFAVEGEKHYAFSGYRARAATNYFLAWYDGRGNYIKKEPYRGSMDAPVIYTQEIVESPKDAAYAYLNVRNTIPERFAFYDVEYIRSQKVYDEEIRSPLTKWELIGHGDSYHERIITDIIPGHKYRIYVKSWPEDQLVIHGSNYIKLGFKSIAGEDTTLLEASYLQDTLKPYYDVVLPQDSEGIVYCGRLNNGEEGVLYVEDLTSAANVEINEDFNTVVDNKVAGAEHVADFATNDGYVLEKITSVQGQSRELYALMETDKYGTSTSYSHIRIPVRPGDIVKIKANSSKDARFAFLTSLRYTSSGGDIPVVEGTHVALVPVDETWVLRIPDGAVCLSVFAGLFDAATDAYDSFPATLEVYRKVYEQPFGEVTPIDSYGLNPVDESHIEPSASRNSCVFPLYPGREYEITHTAIESSLVDNYCITKGIPSTVDDNIVPGTQANSYSNREFRQYHIVDEPCYFLICCPSERVSVKSRALEVEDTQARSDIDVLVDNTRFTDVMLPAGEMPRGYINPRNNCFVVANTLKAYSLIPISGKFLKIVGNATADSYYAFLTNDELPDTTWRFTNNFADDGHVYKVPAGESVIVQIPSDARYLYIVKTYPLDTDATPLYIGVSDGKADSDGGSGDPIFDEINVLYLEKYNHWINLSTNVYNTSTSSKHILVNVSGVKKVKFIANDSLLLQYAWFTKKDVPSPGGIPPFVSGTVVNTIPVGEEGVAEVPDGAKMMYIYIGSNYSYPKYVGIYTGTDDQDEFDEDFNARRDRQLTDYSVIGLTPLNPDTDSDGWVLPTTLQQLNALKKSEQLINIRWTPKLNVPARVGGKHPAGVEVTTGIPYSSNNDDGSKIVGEEVSFHTFMTALDNPYSLIYTECVNNETKHATPKQHSSWGKVYTESYNGTTYYGTVCCGLTSSVVNAPLKWGNPIMNRFTRTNGVFVPVCPRGTVNFELLKIGDICDNDGHSVIIYGLHYDSNGLVDKVTVAESTSTISSGPGGCQFKRFNDRSSFESYINKSGDPFTILRYVRLWDNTDYEPSEYVPLVDRGEPITPVTYNNAICTFAGDKVTFREGDLVVVNYNLYGTQDYPWTKIKVYKDDVLLYEKTLAEAEQSLIDFYNGGETPIVPNPFNAEIDQSNHALVLGTELAGGMYKACMSDGVHDSDFTYWEVLSAPITVDAISPDNYKVKVGGSCDIQVVYVNGMYYLPTLEELRLRRFTVHPISLSRQWNYTYDTFGIEFRIKGQYGNTKTFPASLSGAFVPGDESEDD